MQSATLTQIRPDPASIKERWKEESERSPGRFPSEIAESIGITEAELMAARVGEGVTRLIPDQKAILSALGRLGPVHSVTRNRYAVIEKNGVYPEFQHFGMHSMYVSEDIDLRISLGFWGSTFAVVSPGRDGRVSRSLQFYGKDGAAVHKLFLTRESSLDGFEDLLQEFVNPDQSATEPIDLAFGRRATAHRDDVDAKLLLADWAALRDTHEFFGLLHKHKISRIDALSIGEGRFTRRVALQSARRLIEHVAGQDIKVMVFVGNSGCIQIHKGRLKKVVERGGWLNVMDPEVELHLAEPGVAGAWVVEKPTVDGYVASLELFDPQERDVLSIFGVRQEGKRQDAEWYKALELLPDAAVSE